MQPPRLTFACELDPARLGAMVADAAVIEDLRALGARVTLMRSDLSPERAAAVQRLNAAAIPYVVLLVCARPRLGDDLELRAVAVGSTGGDPDIPARRRFPRWTGRSSRDLRLAWHWGDDLYIHSLEGPVRQGFLERLRAFDWGRSSDAAEGATLAAGLRRAVLHLIGTRHAEAATPVRCQIAQASSSNATASRRIAGSSIASS